MAKELSADTHVPSGLARHEATGSTTTGLRAIATRWLSAVIDARQRTAMDQIARFDPDLARRIRDVQDAKPPAD